MAVVVRRLTQRKNFLRLKAEGRRVNTPAFVLQWLDEPAEPGLGVGFTASGALGGAVVRNRARRRLKACFDDVCRLNEACTGAGKWLVLVAKHPVMKLEYAYLRKDMRRALAEAGVGA